MPVVVLFALFLWVGGGRAEDHVDTIKLDWAYYNPRLMPWLKVSHNVRLGLGPSPDREDEKLVTEAIAKVGLERFAHALPRELSGGMAQRVAIARALVARAHWYCWTSRLARWTPSTG
jgi:ABC-type nitrate/sulfonate/bicarbonate transport system ATPase subunit